MEVMSFTHAQHHFMMLLELCDPNVVILAQNTQGFPQNLIIIRTLVVYHYSSSQHSPPLNLIMSLQQ